MKKGLYSANLQLITPYVKVVPKQDVVKVENRLLDGSFHVQTIGTAAKLLAISLLATDETVRERVDTASATCEEVKIVYGAKYYDGIIRGSLNWEKTAGVYKTDFELLVIRFGELE